MLALPSKATLFLASKDDPKEIEAMLERDIYEALAELADYEPSLFFEEDEIEDNLDMVGGMVQKQTLNLFRKSAGIVAPPKLTVSQWEDAHRILQLLLDTDM
ncbi:MAG: hypothetical protein ABS942_15820 [Solibacillus sp.]|uniref:hypothetical protein n=1 Tax=Solibacillus sp. FSL H8-0523 TaxID=2954511 RepID=UPI0031018C49